MANAIPNPRHVPSDPSFDVPKIFQALEWEFTSLGDRAKVGRRRLPLVKIAQDYVLDGSTGKHNLNALFDGRPQLVVHHFRFDPAWDTGCQGCAGYVDSLGEWSILNERDTTFILVSRAPLDKLEAYKAQKGWTVPWFSSSGSDFTHDFHVALHCQVAPALGARSRSHHGPGEEHGLSVFFRRGDDIFHTYSVCARDARPLADA
jgi:predicted dithiol-disulfide oxidoreductase (DUF899 family)